MAARRRKKRDPATGSEYGGLPGLIAPDPHTPTPQERAMIMRIRAAGDGQGGTRPLGGGEPNRADAEGWPVVDSERLA